nr:MAG TPA: TFIIB zinc-binding [Caudoviricetes sp.]
MKREIKCSECGKHLFNTDKPDGPAMSEALRMGFVAKMPFLYGISGCFFFCNKECNKEWAKKNISKEAKVEGDKSIAKLKAEQPQMVEDMARAASRLVEVLNKFKKK